MAAHAAKTIDLAHEKLDIHQIAPALYRYAGLIGLAAMALSIVIGLVDYFALGGPKHSFFSSYLANFFFFLSLSLAATFFVLIQHITRAGWSVVVRRIAEAVSANFDLHALLAIGVLIGSGALYKWAWIGPEKRALDELLVHKHPYLNEPFLLLRLIGYFLVWYFVSRFYLGLSARQDQTGDPQLTIRMQTYSAVCIVLMALTATFASFDLVMSLYPHWYSTIFGVYVFSGGMFGFFALTIIIAVLLQRYGRATHVITPEHYHDLGKFMFAFTVFWAYIAYSQYMLQWYADIPEETQFWFARGISSGAHLIENPAGIPPEAHLHFITPNQTAWTPFSIFLLVGHFIIPFFLLISRYPKRRPRLLVVLACWVLLMHWLDMIWLVKPNPRHATNNEIVVLTIMDFTLLIGMGGLFVAAVARHLRKLPVIPIRDPRLNESLRFENA